MAGVISVTGNLPVALTSFVGRGCDIAEVRCLLGSARLLTLTGVGGVGKSRLALEAAAASRKAFPDGTWLVDLAPVRDPSAVASGAAIALGVPDLGTRPVLEELVAYLAERQALIALDNCEHLVDACAELAGTLLSTAPGLRILATSRQSLGIAGEHVLTVAPLSVPEEAVELLRDRAAAVQQGFRITNANWADAFRLCAALDGLPLAIELAASRLRTLTVGQMVDRLADRFALLTGGSRTARPRQRTLRALVDWSYELCTPAERLLWNRLSVFTGGFALDAVESVCADDGIVDHEVLDLLDRLVDQSVVMPIENEGLPRYRLLETIREYGRARLAESGDEQRLRQRHHDFCLALAEQIADGWWGPGQEEALARLRAEHGNLLVALDYESDPQAALALAAALRYHWCAGGFLGEGRRRLDRAIAAAPEPTAARAQALWAAGWVALLQGDVAVADQWLDEADRLGQQQGDARVRAQAMALRGLSALFQGRLEEAASLLEGAAAAPGVAGEGVEVFVLFQLVTVQTHLGDPRAAETGRHAVAMAEAHGERLARAQALWAWGFEAWVRGNPEEGIALIRAGLQIQQGLNDYIGTALMLEVLAWITASGGDNERAGRLLGAARALLRVVGTTIDAFGPHLSMHHAHCEETVLRALGPAAYEKTLADGSGHDGPRRAIAYALNAETGTGATAPAAAPSPLTRREREVAALVAKGMSNRQIAAVLVLSRRTVDGHVENIRAKLGFASRSGIATWWTANQGPAA